MPTKSSCTDSTAYKMGDIAGGLARFEEVKGVEMGVVVVVVVVAVVVEFVTPKRLIGAGEDEGGGKVLVKGAPKGVIKPLLLGVAERLVLLLVPKGELDRFDAKGEDVGPNVVAGPDEVAGVAKRDGVIGAGDVG